MTVAEFIKKLKKIEATDPSSEMFFYVHDLSPESTGYRLVFDTAISRHSRDGRECLVVLVSDRELPK